MRLTLKNIGKIKNADVEIDGITVIAGENNTGKSTVGRALFAMMNAFCNTADTIQKERINSVVNYLNRMCMSMMLYPYFDSSSLEVVSRIINFVQNGEDEQAKREVIEYIHEEDDEDGEDSNTVIDEHIIGDTLNSIKKNTSISDEKILQSLIQEKLRAEFNGQIGNIFVADNSEILLSIKKQKIEVVIEGDEVTKIQNEYGISLQDEVIYVDDPFVLDNLSLPQSNRRYRDRYRDHRDSLQIILKESLHAEGEENIIDKIIVQDQIKEIFNKISQVCEGQIIRKKLNSWGYQKAGTDKILNVRNLSTGFKTFVILKILLTNGTIKPKGVIILDEPEIHLHPEWQLLFAEIVVLLQKSFDIHVLLNTHSPYFLRAIQVYSAEHGIADRCKYYMSELTEDRADIVDVTENTEKIYEKLSRPLQILSDKEWADG